jgi:hypothetical protein
VSTTPVHADPAALLASTTIPLNTQASLSPSHPTERASIVKTVFDRIAGASLAVAATVAIATSPASAIQMGLPEEEVTKLICDAACETTINDAELVTTQSGLQYRDIKVGDGVQPEIGFQVGKFILILVWAIGVTSCCFGSQSSTTSRKTSKDWCVYLYFRTGNWCSDAVFI